MSVIKIKSLLTLEVNNFKNYLTGQKLVPRKIRKSRR